MSPTGGSKDPMTRVSQKMKQIFKRQPGERVRFYGAQRIPVAGNTCRVRVRLDVPSGGSYTGVAKGPAGLDDELKSAAAATLDALGQIAKARKVPVRFELTEAAPFEAFGKAGVMVSIKVDYGSQSCSLLGFSPVEGDGLRSVSVAVLSATNRILGIA